MPLAFAFISSPVKPGGIRSPAVLRDRQADPQMQIVGRWVGAAGWSIFTLAWWKDHARRAQIRCRIQTTRKRGLLAEQPGRFRDNVEPFRRRCAILRTRLLR